MLWRVCLPCIIITKEGGLPFSRSHSLPSNLTTVVSELSPELKARWQNFFTNGTIWVLSVGSSRKEMRSQRVSSAATRTQHSSSFISSISSGRMEDLACSRLREGEREREGRERERQGERGEREIKYNTKMTTKRCKFATLNHMVILFHINIHYYTHNT